MIRRCNHCRRRLPAGARRDRIYCDGRCKRGAFDAAYLSATGKPYHLLSYQRQKQRLARS